MSGNFLALPRELHDFIYEFTLVDQDDSDQGTWIYPRPLSPQLLRTNKLIHHEATSLLYTHIRFYSALWSPELLTSFRNRIGSGNAKHVRHVRTDFSLIFSVDLGDLTLRGKSIHILEMIRSYFPGLYTLTTSL